MKLSLKNIVFLWLAIISLFTQSCIKNDQYTANSKLLFSKDTVYFDTIFTRMPGTTYPISVTKMLSIKNNENAWVKANFKVAGGINSPYKINIDGIGGKEIKDLDIGPNDSVFIFVQCALEANNTINPALVLDSLIANVGQSTSKLILAAYGWDAHYVKNEILPNNTVWSDVKKPYVIVESIEIAVGNTFTIEKGVQVFASSRTGIFVLGDYNIRGTAQERVKIRGDKPVFATEKLPNQWGGIFILPGGKGKIEYADILNATIGIRVDSLLNTPSLIINQSKIQYCGQASLIGVTSSINATNCLFADVGSYTFLAYLGGKYVFNHCTFAEYSGINTRQQGHFAITNTQRDPNGVLLKWKDLDFTLTNSIVDGPMIDEIYLDKVSKAVFNVNSNNNLLKTKDPQKLFSTPSNYFNRKDIGFIDFSIGNYAIDSTSFGISKAGLSNPINVVDITGKLRKNPCDIGAYEK